MAAKRAHYVDNKKFLEAFKNYLPVVRPLRAIWLKERKKLIAKGVRKEDLPKFTRPQTPDYDYIGECLLKIAEHLSFKPNFMNYTFREDMVGDSIENAVMYLENFDPEKSGNPFAYFTQVMKWAFIRRIAKEDKQSYIKQKTLEGSANFFSTQSGDEGDYSNTYIEFIKDAKSDVVSNFEEKKRAKKKNTARIRKAKAPGMEQFLTDVVEEPSEINA